MINCLISKKFKIKGNKISKSKKKKKRYFNLNILNKKINKKISKLSVKGFKYLLFKNKIIFKNKNEKN